MRVLTSITQEVAAFPADQDRVLFALETLDAWGNCNFHKGLHENKLGNAILNARKAAQEREDNGLAPGEFLITLDGQKPGNNLKFKKLLKRFGRKLIV